jgi:hypothetical protein
LDEIGIAMRQKDDESRGVQISRADVAGSLCGPSNGLDTSKGKGKAVTLFRSNDEVSSVDDHPLQRRRRQLHSDGRPIGGPPTNKVADRDDCLHVVVRSISGCIAVDSTRCVQSHR